MIEVELHMCVAGIEYRVKPHLKCIEKMTGRSTILPDIYGHQALPVAQKRIIRFFKMAHHILFYDVFFFAGTSRLETCKGQKSGDGFENLSTKRRTHGLLTGSWIKGACTAYRKLPKDITIGFPVEEYLMAVGVELAAVFFCQARSLLVRLLNLYLKAPVITPVYEKVHRTWQQGQKGGNRLKTKRRQSVETDDLSKEGVFIFRKRINPVRDFFSFVH